MSTWSLVDTTQVSTPDRIASPDHTDPGRRPTAEAHVASEVGGIKISVPAGTAKDRGGNLSSAASKPLYLSHNWKVSVADASATEGTDATIDFVVTLNAQDDCKTVTVDWATEDGTATAGEDYTAANGTLTFGPGETTKTVSVAVLDDEVEDDDETFTLTLSNPQGVEVEDGEATGTILDAQAPANRAPTGLPTISGTAEVGVALTASVDGIEDADGLTSATFAYQWVSNDGTSDSEIADATEATYEVAATDLGKTLKVRVVFTDDGDTEEMLTSASTATVLGPITLSVADAPTDLEANAGDRQVMLSWTQGFNGGHTITEHHYCQKRSVTATCAEGDWTVIPMSGQTGTNATSYTVTGLDNGTAYTFRVRAKNSEGNGAASVPATATPVAAIALKDQEAYQSFTVPSTSPTRGITPRSFTFDFETGGTGSSDTVTLTLFVGTNASGTSIDLVTFEPTAGINTIAYPLTNEPLTRGSAYSIRIKANSATSTAKLRYVTTQDLPTGWSLATARVRARGSSGSGTDTGKHLFRGIAIVGAPGAPVLTANPRNAEVLLSWTVPDDGGSAVTTGAPQASHTSPSPSPNSSHDSRPGSRSSSGVTLTAVDAAP